MVESFGPGIVSSITKSPTSILRKAIENDLQIFDKISSGAAKQYKTMKEAIDKRIENNKLFSKLDMSYDCAKYLVQRLIYKSISIHFRIREFMQLNIPLFV